MRNTLGISLMLSVALASVGFAQSSALYVTQTSPAGVAPGAPAAAHPRGATEEATPAGVTLLDEKPPGNRPGAELAAGSLLAVKTPEPRKLAVNDLVTIVVREDTESGSNSQLNTKKENNVSAELAGMPNIRGVNLLANLFLKGGAQSDPKLDLTSKSEFKGTGDYSRKDSMTTRVTAKILDVKPNGTLVLEARKFIQSDDESLEIVVTGTCRKQDIAVDNTVQSTQLYDLRLNKQHTGELRNATQKGILSKIFDTIFNF